MTKKETNTSKNKNKRVAVSKEEKVDASELENKIKKLEHTLILSERKGLGLFELTNDAIFIVGMDGVYLDVNQRAAEMLGYNRQDLIGSHSIDFVSKEERESTMQRLSDLRAGRILPIYTRNFKRRDGSIFPSEINVAVVQDEEGNPAYIQSAVRDISERVEAEEALERERKAYSLISEAIIYSESLKDFCNRCLSGLTSLLGFDDSTIRTFDKDSRMLIPITSISILKDGDESIVGPKSIDDPNFIFSLTARTKRIIVSTRFEDRAILAPFAKRLKKLNVHALISWPILDAKEELLGTLQLVSYKYKEITEEDIFFFDTITHMFTVAFVRKRSDDALRDSEEKYRSFAQNFQGIVYRIRTDNKPVFYNGAMEEISGYTSEELTSMNPKWIDIVHPDDQEMVTSEFIHLLSLQCVFIEIEYRIIRKDGLVRWVHEIGQTICDESSTPIWIHGAIYDISERKRSEEIQAKQREINISLAATSNLSEALSVVLEVTSEMDVVDSGSIYIVNKDTRFLDLISTKNLHKKVAKELAYFSTHSPFTQSILSGKPVYLESIEYMTENIDEIFKREGIQAIANIPIISEGKIVAAIFLASHKSLSIPMNTRNALETIASQIGGSISRIRAEDALRDSDERYRTFVQNFQGIAYRSKPNWKPVFLHGAIKEITGYTSEELLSEKPSWREIIHPYDFPELEKATEKSIAAESKIGKCEYRLITKNGDIVWIRDVWQVLTNEKGKATSFQGSIYNISDRKEAQNELEKLYQDLEKRVGERTEQLTLINKELTAFSYSVSHDLRTPLRHISGFANLLTKRIEKLPEKDERILSYTQKIITSTEEMNKLIDGLLVFSRMSRVEIVKIRINFTELVQDVLNDFQIELGNRKIDVAVHFLPDVVGDPSLLRLVLVNLISNAFKFTKICDIAQIEIGIIPSKEDDKITVYIRDNGVGFDMKYYDRLFGVFQRLHKNEDFEGTGIGLATVQRVIRRMGGMIWAEGDIDKGATFYFSVPKAVDEK